MWDELIREETRYRWFIRNAAEVVGVLECIGATYALYKFRRPFEHVSVDLDVLVRVEDVSRAVRALVSRGFRVIVWEPYTVTLARSGFIVDLYTHPSFAWVVYMDGGSSWSAVLGVEVGGLVAETLCGGWGGGCCALCVRGAPGSAGGLPSGLGWLSGGLRVSL